MEATRYLCTQPKLRPFPAFAYGSVKLLAECLREGALDYLAGPVDARELQARISGRIQAIEERRLGTQGAGLKAPNRSSILEGREEKLLRLLLLAEGSVISREALSLALWGEIRTNSRRLDMLVSKLRRKLGESTERRGLRLRAVRNEGYSLRLEPVDNL